MAEKLEKVVRLMLEPSAEALEGLENITVERIDADSSENGKTSILFTLNGFESLSDHNGLGRLREEFEKKSNTETRFRFTGIDYSDYVDRNATIREYLASVLMSLRSDYRYLSISSLFNYMDIGGERVISIVTDKPNEIMTDEETRKEFGESVLREIKTFTGLEFSSYMYEYGDTMSELINDLPSYETSEYEELERPDNIDEVIEVSQPVKKGKKKIESVAIDEEGKINKDSLLYKAKEQQKIASAQQKESGEAKKFRSNMENVICGRVRNGCSVVSIEELSSNDPTCNIVGSIVTSEEPRVVKGGTLIVANYNVFDKTGGIKCVQFLKPEEADNFWEKFKKGGYAGFQGKMRYNKLSEPEFVVDGIYPETKPEGRKDYSEKKRVELHVHSKMSMADAISNPADIMKLAASFGHPACAITDHGVVQGFPEACEAAKKLTVGDTDQKFKAILGCEGYVCDDGPTVVYNIPFDEKDIKHIGQIVSISIKTDGNDSCENHILSIVASKYRLKGYKSRPIPLEGESLEDANAFSAKDIDYSLWSMDELPESLRNVDGEAEAEVRPEGDICHYFNKTFDYKDIISATSEEEVPEAIEYEHLADFYCKVNDIIYKGTGEPSDSYFKMADLLEFIGDSYVCGQDILRTLDFLRRAGYGINIEDHKYYRNKFMMPAICTADVLEYLFDIKENSDTRLIADNLGIKDSFDETEAAGFISDDMDMLRNCRLSALITIAGIKKVSSTNPTELNKAAGHKSYEVITSKATPANHIILLARNNLALYNLYNLISESHVHYFFKRPRMPRSLMKYYHSSIIIGSACERGEVYCAIYETYKELKKDREATLEKLTNSYDFRKMIKLYDYLEIQPLTNNAFYTRKAESVPITMDDIRIINEIIVDMADFFKLPCVATTDSHFLEKEDGMYRANLLYSMGFKDAGQQADLYFRTTDEMLEEFSYLGEKKAMEVVVDNTNLIADKIEYGLKPFPDGTYPPIIKTAARDVRDITWTCANKLYRHNGVLNEDVRARLEKELNSIIGNGYAIMYYIAYRLVKKSNNDGYIVGSRGSVGSSLVATMCGITEVNPLTPHYRCPKCHFVEFDRSGTYGSGFDMPEKTCPECGTLMNRDGQDIPFETFLGFYGDKQPDIDLNFSGEYQPNAHKYVEILFGKNHTFRAGTIGTYAEKNAIGVAKAAVEAQAVAAGKTTEEAKEISKSYPNAKLEFMSKGLVGVKRTTSQHPGGIVVVPKEMDVCEFTPIQYPANKTDCGIITTHFDFHAMHDTILKLDILGHADPTVLRMLHDLTKVDITSIPVPEPKVMSLLESTDALGFPLSATEAGSATLGLSEMGTNMARGMIAETHPKHFYDLVQLMGLSHGTDVWTGNAQDLIREGICDINTVIGCRDSIMTSLMYWGVPNKDSFDIMEKVRKGKGLSEAHESIMREHNVPDWYIDSCKKIKYMFPKAHAAAYSLSSLRVAWFKVYYPEEYYCAFFTIRGDEFNATYMCQGEAVLTARRRELGERMHVEDNPKVKSEFYLCEIVEEMYHRGIEFLPIDLKTSDAEAFKKVAPKKILPPLNVIDSISTGIARNIVKARDEKPFDTKDDILVRAGIGESALKKLVDYGLCEGMPDSAQMSIFDMLGQ